MAHESRKVSRRTVITAAAAGAMTPLAFAHMEQTQTEDRWPSIPDFPEKTPQIPAKIVKKFVIAAHGNLPVVKEMLEAYPGLLNAGWDWGSGDFERAIEGAGHMGNHEIAEYLLSKGARMNLFCAAMMGNLDFVKAVLAETPTLKDSHGPHGLNLLHHAKAGKERSAHVLAFVESLG